MLSKLYISGFQDFRISGFQDFRTLVVEDLKISGLQ
jgi:hypothetical protein